MLVVMGMQKMMVMAARSSVEGEGSAVISKYAILPTAVIEMRYVKLLEETKSQQLCPVREPTWPCQSASPKGQMMFGYTCPRPQPLIPKPCRCTNHGAVGVSRLKPVAFPGRCGLVPDS